jgi:hypothetical protein
VISVFALARAQVRLGADAIVVFGPFYSFIAAPCRLFLKARIILFSRGELLKSLAETRTGISRPFILIKDSSGNVKKPRLGAAPISRGLRTGCK